MKQILISLMALTFTLSAYSAVKGKPAGVPLIKSDMSYVLKPVRDIVQTNKGNKDLAILDGSVNLGCGEFIASVVVDRVIETTSPTSYKLVVGVVTGRNNQLFCAQPFGVPKIGGPVASAIPTTTVDLTEFKGFFPGTVEPMVTSASLPQNKIWAGAEFRYDLKPLFDPSVVDFQQGDSVEVTGKLIRSCGLSMVEMVASADYIGPDYKLALGAVVRINTSMVCSAIALEPMDVEMIFNISDYSGEFNGEVEAMNK